MRVRPDSLFIDTSAWVALFNGNDRGHPTAVEFYRQVAVHRPRLTTNFVIGETYTRLMYAAGYRFCAAFLGAVRDALESRALQVIYSTPEFEERAHRLLVRYRTEALSYVDAVSFAVLQESEPEVRDVFGFDRHFLSIGRYLLPGRVK